MNEDTANVRTLKWNRGLLKHWDAGGSRIKPEIEIPSDTDDDGERTTGHTEAEIALPEIDVQKLRHQKR